MNDSGKKLIRGMEINMEIRKEILAKLNMVYAINFISVEGRDCCVAASEEKDGKMILIDCLSGEVRPIVGLTGGVMCFIPFPKEEGRFIAIQGFYPIFQSEEAQIVCGRISLTAEDGAICKDVRIIANLPFVHRIMLAGKAGKRKILAGTLCAAKQYQEDWSSPGAVYLLDLEDNPHNDLEKCCVLSGIHKHHGMTFHQGTFYVSGMEGVFGIVPDSDGCSVQKLLPGCISDLCLYDLDGDDEDEFVVITPFHGNQLQVLKKTADGLVCLAEREMAFGHAVWAGSISGVPCILACNRGGSECTVLYRVVKSERGIFTLEDIMIDSKVGASNIAVREENGQIILYAANHGTNEAVRYTISLELH